MALDLYVYLMGGRGDGFVPQWDGTIDFITREEFSAEYTDPPIQTSVRTADGSQISGNLLISGVADSNTPTYTPIGSLGVPVAALRTVSPVGVTLNDVTPQQFTRQVKWRRYRGEGGFYFEFREDKIIGHGGQARTA